jgi:hypothetical protein
MAVALAVACPDPCRGTSGAPEQAEDDAIDIRMKESRHCVEI